jgi:hypothetical protein
MNRPTKFPNTLTGPAILPYLRAAGVLLSNETLADIPVRWMPKNAEQVEAMDLGMAGFILGDEVGFPFAPNWDSEAPKKKARRSRRPTQDDLIPDGREPVTCGSLCILNRAVRRW